MPRKPRIPAYSLHKPSGRAVVKVNQRSISLGKYGSDESRDTYARIIADLLAGRAITPPVTSNQGIPTLDDGFTPPDAPEVAHDLCDLVGELRVALYHLADNGNQLKPESFVRFTNAIYRGGWLGERVQIRPFEPLVSQAKKHKASQTNRRKGKGDLTTEQWAAVVARVGKLLQSCGDNRAEAARRVHTELLQGEFGEITSAPSVDSIRRKRAPSN